MSPGERADLVRRAVTRLDGIKDTQVFGNVVSGATETAIANSKGLEAYFEGSVARFQVTSIASSRGAGIARHVGRSMRGADPEALADASIQKASRFRAFEDVPPGDYDVVLEPPAVGETLFHLGYLGFGGYGHLQGSSCFAGQIGAQVLSPLVTLRDDPLHPTTMCESFDGEGTPRHSMCLVEKGVIRGAVHDLETAEKAGVVSTGHGLGPEGSWFSEGPFPRHLALEPGSSCRDALISHVEHGLLITSFHYTRPLDPKRAIITGMTRNGTFLIRDGRITAMLPNLRFAVSAIALLANVREIGNDVSLAGDYVCHLTPSIRTTGFSVMGKTEG
jgi:predicted Zn-dependent protease